MKPMLSVTVNQDHIDRGLVNHQFACPITLAIEEAMHEAGLPFRVVGNRGNAINISDNVFNAPAKSAAFTSNFDVSIRRNQCVPFTFKIPYKNIPVQQPDGTYQLPLNRNS